MLQLFSSAGPATPTIAIYTVIVGVLVLAALDIWRREVEDLATVALLGITLAMLAITGINAQQWISAILSGAIAFCVYMLLGMRGVMGGGDVKLSPVPALVLGAASPFLGVWWICAAILIQHAFHLVLARRRRAVLAHGAQADAAVLPHVPAMAAAMLVAVGIFPITT